MTREYLDAHGQPVNSGFCRRGRHDRTVDELIGLAKGMVADGVISDAEAGYLRQWLEENAQHASTTWPVNVIYDRVQVMLADGVIDADEREELFDLLRQVVSPDSSVAEQVANLSAQLPFDDPLPEIVFEGRSFCFTGKFAFGARKRCENEINIRNGIVAGTITQKLDYLVIGVIGSRDWAHTTHGRKIEKAVALREQWGGLAIVGEEHWHAALILTPFTGQRFLFLGDFQGFDKEEAFARLRKLGGEPAKNLTASIHYVVAGASPGPRLEKARALGVPIIDQAEFERMVGNEGDKIS